ncbi:MAG: hypothetical protein B6U89_04600 [Desulfurococcales archaeon ex4484_58]|nr:MAG: hypothetical protein B6U89_04600 [Desulfurococcales archaeon ex4484_58]
MGYWAYFSNVWIRDRRIVLTEHIVKKYGIRRNDSAKLEALARKVGDVIGSSHERFRDNIAPNRYVAVRRENNRYTIVVYERNGSLYIITMIENISEKRYNRMRKNRIKNKRWVRI